MILSARSFLETFDSDAKVRIAVVAFAAMCGIVLLALFVHTLNVAIERGEALRAQQRLAQHAPAGRLLTGDVRVSDARIGANP